MRERAQHLTDRPRRRAHTFPNAAVIDRNAGQQKPRLAQSGEVSGDQFPPLLALTPLRRKVRGYRAEVFVDGARVHRDLPPFGLSAAAIDCWSITRISAKGLCRKPDFSLRWA